MTVKRFVINNDMSLDGKVEAFELSCIVDNDNKTFYFIVDSMANVESFVERLNTLYEENEKLNQRLKISNDNVKILQCENEQLKKSIKRQQGSNNECAKLIKEQQKENEQLKI